MRRTRRYSYFHIFSSVLSLLFVIAYAVVQGMSGDYKEMMTAIIAMVFTFYHIARTVWGLVQLRAYMGWCEHTHESIRAALPIIRENDNDLQFTFDSALMVNEDVVDNKFTDRDVQVSLKWPLGNMKVSHADLCTVRWVASYLCSLGHLSLFKGRKTPHESVPRVLFRILMSTTVLMDHKRPDSSIVCIPKMAGGLEDGAFASNVRHLLDIDSANKYFTKFENIIGSYTPSISADEKWNTKIDQNLVNAKIEDVVMVLTLRCIGPKSLHWFNCRLTLFYCPSQLDCAWDLLHYQLEPVLDKKVRHET